MTTNTHRPQKIRRPWLMVPASQRVRAVAASQSNPDVVLLDLVEFVPEQEKPSAREGLAETVQQIRVHGRMIDVPVDEWAKDVLALAKACRLRDEEKQSALESASP